MSVPTTNGPTNGYTNGHVNGHSTEVASMNGSSTHEHHNSSAKYAESRTTNTENRTLIKSSHSHTFTSAQQVTVLRHTVTTTRSKFCELSHVDDYYIDSLDVESFLEYIETERLTYMPQRGSKWDKVLKWVSLFIHPNRIFCFDISMVSKNNTPSSFALLSASLKCILTLTSL
jgi:hypothetical protein